MLRLRLLLLLRRSLILRAPQVLQGLQRCRAYYGNKAGQTRQERADEAMKDPEIQDIMNDPVMRSILNQMSTVRTCRHSSRLAWLALVTPYPVVAS